jgi:hypothetical protein
MGEELGARCVLRRLGNGDAMGCHLSLGDVVVGILSMTGFRVKT